MLTCCLVPKTVFLCPLHHETDLRPLPPPGSGLLLHLSPFTLLLWNILDPSVFSFPCHGSEIIFASLPASLRKGFESPGPGRLFPLLPVVFAVHDASSFHARSRASGHLDWPLAAPLAGTVAGTGLVLLGTRHPSAGHRSGLSPPFSISCRWWEGSSVQLRACWHGFQQEVTSIFLCNLLTQPFPKGISLPPRPSFRLPWGAESLLSSVSPLNEPLSNCAAHSHIPALHPQTRVNALAYS